MTSRVPVTLKGEEVGWAEVEEDGGMATIYFNNDSEVFDLMGEQGISSMSIYMEEEK